MRILLYLITRKTCEEMCQPSGQGSSGLGGWFFRAQKRPLIFLQIESALKLLQSFTSHFPRDFPVAITTHPPGEAGVEWKVSLKVTLEHLSINTF